MLKVIFLICLAYTTISGKSLLFSRIPSAFSLLFHTKYVYELHTEPQTFANEKNIYWPRGSFSSQFTFVISNSCDPRQNAGRMLDFLSESPITILS